MSQLRALHISDLHFHGDNHFDQKIVLNALIKDIAARSKERPIDIVIFSGDLVNAGTSNEMFSSAHNALVRPILTSAGVSEERFFICPGNHDINREIVRKHPFIETGLTGHLISRDSINTFVEQYYTIDPTNVPLPEAFSRMESYYQSAWGPRKSRGAHLTPFSCIETIKLGDISLGVATFNTAWRCTGEADNADRGNLVLGERVIDLAADRLKGCTLKLAVFHHPTDWLRDADRAAVEGRLQAEFDAFFFGHVHTVSPQYSHQALGGAFYSQAGCLYQHRDYFNGYSIVDFDVAGSRIDISAYEYSDRIREFAPALGAIPGGKATFSASFGNGDKNASLAVLMAKVRPAIRRLGNDHVRLASDDSSEIDIETHFVCPPLELTERNNLLGDRDFDDKSKKVVLSEILRTDKNIIVSGRPESGKTSIAHFAALQVSLGQADEGRVPLLAKFYDFQRGRSPLWRAVRDYANEISDGHITSQHLERHPLFIVVDQVDFSDLQQAEILFGEMKAYPKARWMLIGDGVVPKGEHTDLFTEVSVKELPRTSIRTLSAQWLNQEPDAETTDKAFRQVMEHIRRSGLPRSGYIVSLILWTIKNKSAAELMNEAVLLQNILDYILGKMDYRGALRSEFDFTSKTAVLQELANHLQAIKSTPSKNEIVEWVITYFKRKGLSYDAAKIVEGFISCGVLAEIGDAVTFRYKRFQEFFMAGYLRDNPDALEEVLRHETWNGFAREMDIYTSRFRHEARLLDIALNKVKSVPFREPVLIGQSLYDYIGLKGNADLATKRLTRMREEPRTAQQIDRMRDRAEEHFARKRLPPVSDSDLSMISDVAKFLRQLEVYSQFVRNLEFVDNNDKREHLNNCLEYWVVNVRGMSSDFKSVFEELNKELKQTAEEGEELSKAEQIVSDLETRLKFSIPTITSTLAHHFVGSEKLAELLEEIAVGDHQETMKRLLANFILLEVDPERAIRVMKGTHWSAMMSIKWVPEVVEERLHKYYQERHLPEPLRSQFVDLIATIESRLAKSGLAKGRMKGLLIQRLESARRKPKGRK